MSAIKPSSENLRQINTALCSFGMSGLVFHAPFIYAHPGFNLYAVWERSKKIAIEKYPSIKSYSSLETMLSDENIDLVIVNTPNHTHFEIAKQALLAKKHVLVEKSFTVTVSEAMELLLLSKQEGKKLALFHNRRFDSDFKTVKKIVDENAIGKILEAEFHFDRFKPALSPKQHKETNIPGAGLLHDLGPHLIDQALYLFGMPHSVFAFLRIIRPKSIVNDAFDITLFYTDLVVRLRSSLMVADQQPAYILHAAEGSFTKYRADIQEDSLKSGAIPGSTDWGIEPKGEIGRLVTINNGKITVTDVMPEAGDYMEYYNGLYAAIINDQPLPVTAEDGLNVMKIIEAALESHHLQKVVTVL